MHAARKSQPQCRANIFQLQASSYGKYPGKRRQIPRIQILVHDVQRGAGHWNCQQSRDQTEGSPTCSQTGKEDTAQLPAGKEKKKDRSHMPQEEACFQGQMCNPQRKRNHIGKKCQTGMRGEELAACWKKLRVQDFLHTRQINLGLLGKGVIPVDEQRRRRQQQQEEASFVTLQSDPLSLAASGVLE